MKPEEYRVLGVIKMRKTQKKLSKRKLLIPIILLVFLFSIVKVGTAIASTDSFIITNAEVSAKSPTADVNNFSFEKCKIMNDVTFHQVGDLVTYKIKVMNNEETNYTIKSVSDDNDNENKYIKYIYDNYEGTKLNSKDEITFEITEKYVQEIETITKRNQNFSVNIIFTLEDEQGNVIEKVIPVNTSSNPQTGDNVGMYITTSVVSLLLLIFLSRRRTVSVKSSKTKQIKTKSRNLSGNARIMNSTIQTNEFNDISNIGKASRTQKKSKKHSGRHYRKHCGKGLKFFGLILAIAIVFPTISKAVTNHALTITFENKIALKDKLIVSYKIKDANYEIITKYNETVTGLDNPDIDGYDFNGWELEDGTDFDPDTTKITDDTTIVPKFTQKTYTISYELNDGTLAEENPSTYTIESNDISLNKPTKFGYTFAGWTGTELTAKVENVTIAKGSTGNREYTANWTPSDYTITYNLNGGTATENPDTYTIESDDINLNKPTKFGYTFTGWTGTELTDKTEDVLIAKGSKGNREYTANWTPTVFTITYQGLTQEEETALNNPTEYTIETQAITLNNPQDRRDSDNDLTERFVGWRENVSVSTNITIPAELENKIYEAVWVEVDPDVYTVTYNLNGGTVSTENRTSFTKYDTFTLNNPSKRGYTFSGWTGSNGTTPETTVTVSTGTRENLSYEANWTEDRYTITYNLDGGNAEDPREYTVNSNDITLNNPTKTGYTFTGWTGTDLTEKTMDVTIPTNSVGNREYTANWQANTYTVIFDRNTGSGSMANQTMTYDVEANLNTNEFTKTGYTFAGWNTASNATGTHYDDKQEVKNLDVDGEVTLYAQWKIIPKDLWGMYENYLEENIDNLTNIDAYGNGDVSNFVIQAKQANAIGNSDDWNTHDLNVLEQIADYLLGSSYSELNSITNNSANYANRYEDIFKYWYDSAGRLSYKESWAGLNELIKATGYNHVVSDPEIKFYNNYPMFFSDNLTTKSTDYAVRLNVETEGDVITKVNLVVVGNGTQYLTFEKSYEGLKRVTFDDDGTRTYKMYEDGSEFGDLPEPLKEGYTFVGWFIENNQVATTDIVVENVTLTARYEINTYTVSFNKNNVDATGTMQDEQFEYNEQKPLTSNAYELANYKFKGWNTSSDGSGTSYSDEEVVKNLTTENNINITLYAQWKEEVEDINLLYEEYLEDHPELLTNKDTSGNANVVAFLQTAIDNNILGTAEERAEFDKAILTAIGEYIINNMTYSQLNGITGNSANYANGYKNIFTYQYDGGGGAGRLWFNDDWDGLYVLMSAGGYEHVSETNPSGKFYNNYPMFFGDGTFAVNSKYVVQLKVTKDASDNITSASLILKGPSENIYTVEVE